MTEGKHISNCRALLATIIEALEMCNPRDEDEFTDLVGCSLWPLTKPHTIRLMHQLERHKATFILALSGDTMFDTNLHIHLSPYERTLRFDVGNIPVSTSCAKSPILCVSG